MKDKIKWLESLRGIACLIVLFAHILSTHPIYGMYASGCGKIGVWIFMILSGYFLLLPYSTSKKNFGLKDIFPYYLKKLVKLFPIYILTLFVAYRFGFILGLKGIVEHLTLQSGWGHLWYMPVIIKFYIISPIFLMLFCILKKYLKNKGIYCYIIVLLSICIFLSLKFPYTAYIENSIDLKWYLPVFVMGMLVALIYSILNKHLNNSFVFDILALCALVMIVIQTPVFRKILYNMPPSRFLQNQYLYMGLFWSIFLFTASFGKLFIKLFTYSKILQKAGEYSFYIYLSHYIILIKLRALYPDFSQRGTITIASSIGFAIIFKYIQDIVNVVYHKILL